VPNLSWLNICGGKWLPAAILLSSALAVAEPAEAQQPVAQPSVTIGTTTYSCGSETNECDLSNQSLTIVPADLFTTLTGLERIHLNNNKLTAVPAGLFDGLTDLEYINLDKNNLTEVPAGLFSGLASLQSIYLRDNPSLSVLPENSFSGLTNLQEIYLNRNNLMESISSQPDLFDGLEAVLTIRINDNKLSSVPGDLFDGLDNLEYIGLGTNNLAKIPATLFDGLSNLEYIGLGSNKLDGSPESLPPGLFTSSQLTSLRRISLNLNPLECRPEIPAAAHFTRLHNRTISSFPKTARLKPCNTITLILSPDTINEGEDSNEATVTAMLREPSSQEISLTVSVEPVGHAMATDFTMSSNKVLSIAPGNTNSTGMVTITAVNNTVDVEDKEFNVKGKASGGAITENGGIIITNGQGIADPEDKLLTITDDDSTLTMVFSASAINESGSSNQTTVTARLNDPLNENIVLTVSVDPLGPAVEGDFTLSSNMLTILAGETISTGTVTITAVDNALNEPNKMSTLQGRVENSNHIG